MRNAEDEAERVLRYRKVREAMAGTGLDLMLTFGPGWRRENVRYLADAPIDASAAFVAVPASGAPSAFTTRRQDMPAIAERGWVTDAHFLDPSSPGELIDRLRDSEAGGCRTLRTAPGANAGAAAESLAGHRDRVCGVPFGHSRAGQERPGAGADAAQRHGGCRGLGGVRHRAGISYCAGGTA
jgi:creatinase/prolidase-like protein